MVTEKAPQVLMNLVKDVVQAVRTWIKGVEKGKMIRLFLG